MREWWASDWRTITTAMELMRDTSKDDPQGRQMSG